MKVELHRIHATDTNEYRIMERLLTAAFPEEEYRELSEFRAFTRAKQNFYNNLIYDGHTLVGFITYWDLGRFYYIEHFATFPEMRNKGYGKTVLTYLQSRLQAPIVLEVECPVDEMTQRRIRFYKRQGFTLWKHEYMQPPYRLGNNWLKLFLMTYGELNEDSDFDFVKRTIHKEVYNYEL